MSQLDRTTQDDPYIAEHVRDALANDPRTEGLELDISVAGNAIVLRGTVTTTRRRDAAHDVIRERFPDWDVHNELIAREFHEPTRAEHLS
jgi:osmotically-inducible protein OsmY